VQAQRREAALERQKNARYEKLDRIRQLVEDEEEEMEDEGEEKDKKEGQKRKKRLLV